MSLVVHLPRNLLITSHSYIDMQTMVELTKFVRRLGKTSPLADIIGTTPWVQSRVQTVADDRLAVFSPLLLCGCWVAREHNPGPEVQTDEELIAWIKQYSNSIARMCSFPSSSPNLPDIPGLGSLTDIFCYFVSCMQIRQGPAPCSRATKAGSSIHN